MTGKLCLAAAVQMGTEAATHGSNTMDKICVAVAALSMLAAMTLPVAIQARRRGYSLSIWLLAGVMVMNPIIFLVLLALMPNRSRKRLREKFRTELDAKLAARPAFALAEDSGAPLTVVPSLTVPSQRSLGDLPTMAPRERSIGDDETRG